MPTEMEGKSRCESTYRNLHTENQRNQQDQRIIRNNWRIYCIWKRKEIKERQKVEEWAEIEEVNNSQNANRTDQLESLRFKMKVKNHNLSKEKTDKFRTTKCQECEKKSQKKKHKTNMETHHEN